MVEISHTSVPFSHLIARLCAIAGGVFTVTGLIDAVCVFVCVCVCVCVCVHTTNHLTQHALAPANIPSIFHHVYYAQ